MMQNEPRTLTSTPRRLLIVSSNGYEDREQDHVASAALAAYVDSAYAGETFERQPLLFWHEAPIGQIVAADFIPPFLIEVAEEGLEPAVMQAMLDKCRALGQAPPDLAPYDAGEAALIWDALLDDDAQWGASIGFFGGKASGGTLYQTIHKIETSILPQEAAANPFTLAKVIKSMDKAQRAAHIEAALGKDNRMTLQERLKALTAKLGKQGLKAKAYKPVAKATLTGDPRELINTLLDSIDATDYPSVLAYIATMIAGGTDGMAEETDELVNQAADDMADVAAQTDDNTSPVPPVSKAAGDVTEDDPAMAVKSVVKGMSSITKSIGDLANLIDSMAERQDASIAALNAKIAQMESRGAAPRRAATAQETAVTDPDLTGVAKQLNTQYVQWGGLTLKKDSF